MLKCSPEKFLLVLAFTFTIWITCLYCYFWCFFCLRHHLWTFCYGGGRVNCHAFYSQHNDVPTHSLTLSPIIIRLPSIVKSCSVDPVLWLQEYCFHLSYMVFYDYISFLLKFFVLTWVNYCLSFFPITNPHLFPTINLSLKLLP